MVASSTPGGHTGRIVHTIGKHSVTNRTTTIIFDFDGTIALGDGPVLAYAQQVAAATSDPAAFMATVQIALAGSDAEVLDGYDAVRRAAEDSSVDPSHLSRAYLVSRAQLGTPEAMVTAPEGLAAFLAEVGAGAERVLVTNAPDIRLAEALEALGLDGLFDQVITGAGKPGGLERILDDLPAGTRVLSIGDIWFNDLAPAYRHGHATALVGDFADPNATPTFRATTLTALLPQLRDWLAGSAGSTAALTPTHTSAPIQTEG